MLIQHPKQSLAGGMTILAAVITTSWWGWEVSEGYMSYRRWCDQHWGIVGERKNQSH